MDQVVFRGVAAALDDLAVGASRIAGPPDLPEGVTWPTVDGKRMPMVLQLALADLAPFRVAARLPRTGTLWFFAAQLAHDWKREGGSIDEMAGAIVYAPPAPLVRATLPPEAADDGYWDRTEIARVEGMRAQVSIGEDDEPRDDDLHVVFPTKKYSSASGLIPPDGFVPVLEMRSDYGIAMNWGDAAWATWVVAEVDLASGRFERATAHVWIG